ncbi:unnamed protein product [Caenorhabditis sp. 36 PRJEB53466]|nr:unnamed protein product [Caenorhabditis sp. 36 PRJEB53466]
MNIQVTIGAKTQSAFDNSIIGQPYISCQRDRIIIEVITERLFTGKVFVKGDYANTQCTRTFRNGAVVSDSEKRTTDERIFPGTVTKSREPYVEDQKKTTKTTTDLEVEKSSSSGSGSNLKSVQPDDLSGNFGIHSIHSTPDVAEGFISHPKNGSSAPDSDSNSLESPEEWKGVGGVANAGGQAVFGGIRGEELRVFEKSSSSSSLTPRSRSGTITKLPPSAQCAPTTCAPCICEEKRSRRATNSIRLEVPLNSCNSKRDRKLNPPSVVVSLVAVVSFHDSFITKLDKAYHIQCAYAEAEKTVSTDLDVNMSDEQELNATVEPPTCDYLISDQRGVSVQNSIVGDLVRHHWTCKGGNASKLKMLVHQCYVKDGADQQYPVIDEHGCTVDPYALQTPTYSEDGMSAQVDAYVLKYPDRSTVDFRCTITFCSIEDAECQVMTPPRCDLNNNLRRKRNTLPHGVSSMSLHANSLTVFDIDSSKSSDSSQLLPTPSSLRSWEELERKFCVSVASFGILISASTFFATICLAVIFSYFFLRFNHKFSLDN